MNIFYVEGWQKQLGLKVNEEGGEVALCFEC